MLASDGGTAYHAQGHPLEGVGEEVELQVVGFVEVGRGGVGLEPGGRFLVDEQVEGARGGLEGVAGDLRGLVDEVGAALCGGDEALSDNGEGGVDELGGVVGGRGEVGGAEVVDDALLPELGEACASGGVGMEVEDALVAVFRGEEFGFIGKEREHFGVAGEDALVRGLHLGVVADEAVDFGMV